MLAAANIMYVVATYLVETEKHGYSSVHLFQDAKPEFQWEEQRALCTASCLKHPHLSPPT